MDLPQELMDFFRNTDVVGYGLKNFEGSSKASSASNHEIFLRRTEVVLRMLIFSLNCTVRKTDVYIMVHYACTEVF